MNKELHAKTLLKAKQYKQSESEFIDALIETDRTKNYAFYGASSLFAYCTGFLGLSESETYRFTQVTRKSVEVPELKAAIKKGDLTVSKASRIAKVITKETQSLWIEKASTLTQRELQKEVAKETKSIIPEEKLQDTFTEEEMKILKRAHEVFRFKTMKETILHCVGTTLKAKDPVEKAKRREPALRQVEPQAYDATSRYIKAALKHQVNLRDKGKCQYKGCGSSYFTEIHHIKPISQGGKHELSNLPTRCSTHHAMKHGFHRPQTTKSSLKL